MRHQRQRLALTALGLASGVGSCAARPDPGSPPFYLRAVDQATGRGVPLVEFETVHGVVFVTDNAGHAVIDERTWQGQEMWFHVRSHGYSVPADGSGYRGLRVVIEPGEGHSVALHRDNIAERLYRITGADLYRDTRSLGLDVPFDDPPPPLGNGGVLGQDSVQNALFDGALYWFWGDTNRASYPLGNFATSGAVSLLDDAGGMDPDAGVALRYFVDGGGFSRRMCSIDGPGPVWIDGLFTSPGVPPTMWCHYARMRDLGTRLEHGLARWDPDNERFEPLVQWPLGSHAHPLGHATRVQATDGGEDWIYFCNPFPAVRARERGDDLRRGDAYEAFTCLEPGARWDPRAPALDRSAPDRSLVWGWKRATDPVDARQWQTLVDGGWVTHADGWTELHDAATGQPVVAHHGHLCWNAYRERWAMVFTEFMGRSLLGEVWYAEAIAPLGPWDAAVRIVTHDDYSFYNVKQHPYFAVDGAPGLYFEGTYTKTFSGTKRGTPRYDYNQIMYRLDLDDPRIVNVFGQR